MADANHLNQADYQALAEFRYQIRRFVRFSEQAAREAGIEPQHHQLMLALKGAPDGVEPCIGYLANRMQIRHHSAVELVDRLVKRGLIQRSRSEEDRREVHVKLSKRGERTLRELTLHTREELRSASPALVETLKKMMVTLHGKRKVPGTNRTKTSEKDIV
jgi:DNA-binding MarR family transcriptional regulator